MQLDRQIEGFVKAVASGAVESYPAVKAAPSGRWALRDKTPRSALYQSVPERQLSQFTNLPLWVDLSRSRQGVQAAATGCQT